MTKGVTINDKLAKHHYDLGLSDKEIAVKLDCYKKSIARWRSIRGLPSNVKHGRPRKGVEAMMKEKNVPRSTSVGNSKRMKLEVTTLAQFGAIGTYEEVAKKYEVGKSTAYSYMKILHQKAREEKQVDVKNTTGTCIPEIVESKVIPSSEQIVTSGEVEVITKGNCQKEDKGAACTPNVDELEQSKISINPLKMKSSFNRFATTFTPERFADKPVEPQTDEHLSISMEPEYEELGEMYEPLSEETLNKINDRVEEVLSQNDGAHKILETSKPTNDVPDELRDAPVDTLLGKISTKTGRYICVDCGGEVDAVGAYAQSSLCSSCNAELNKQAEKLDGACETKTKTIEELWSVLEYDVAILHKMHIEQAERDFQDRLAGVVEEC